MSKQRCYCCSSKLGNSATRIQKVHREQNGNVFLKVITWRIKKSKYICNNCWNDYIKL